jgi:hypothetical protein
MASCHWAARISNRPIPVPLARLHSASKSMSPGNGPRPPLRARGEGLPQPRFSPCLRDRAYQTQLDAKLASSPSPGIPQALAHMLRGYCDG